MELIDREMLRMGATRLVIDGVDFYYARDIDNASVIDAMPVVRCKDCIYYVSEDGYLPYCTCPDGGISDYPQKMDYCSYGKHKDQEIDADIVVACISSKETSEKIYQMEPSQEGCSNNA